MVDYNTGVVFEEKDNFQLTLTVRNELERRGAVVEVYVDGDYLHKCDKSLRENENTCNFYIPNGSTVELVPQQIDDCELTQGRSRTFTMDSTMEYTYIWRETEPEGQYWDLYLNVEAGAQLHIDVNGTTYHVGTLSGGEIVEDTLEIPDGATVTINFEEGECYEISSSQPDPMTFTMDEYKYINVATNYTCGDGEEDYYTLTLTVRNNNTDYGAPVMISENGNYVDTANKSKGDYENTRNYNIEAGSTVELVPWIHPENELIQGERRTFTMDSNKSFTYEWEPRPEPYGNPWGLTDDQWDLCSTNVKELLRDPPVGLDNRVWLNGGVGAFSARLKFPNYGGQYKSGYYARRVANLIKAGGTERIENVLFENAWSKATIWLLSYQEIWEEYS